MASMDMIEGLKQKLGGEVEKLQYELNVTLPGEIRVTSICDTPARATEVSEVASHATPLCSGE